jgi:hypothetical protein
MPFSGIRSMIWTTLPVIIFFIGIDLERKIGSGWFVTEEPASSFFERKEFLLVLQEDYFGWGA